jgi:hypothetical protein
MLFSLLAVSQIADHPVDEVIPGVWTISRVNVTGDGLEVPECGSYRVDLRFFPETDYFYGEIFDQSDGVMVNTVKIRTNVAKDQMNVTFEDGLSVEMSLRTPLHRVKTIHGALTTPNIVYSFVLLSAWRAELTIFDRDLDQLVLYRCSKQAETETMKGVSSFFSYFLRKSLFRFF